VIFTSRHACLEVKFGFKKKIGSLSEGSVPVIFISMDHACKCFHLEEKVCGKLKFEAILGKFIFDCGSTD
jgi:hypothetical protein